MHHGSTRVGLRTIERSTRSVVAATIVLGFMCVGCHTPSNRASRPTARVGGSAGVEQIRVDTISPVAPARLLWLSGRPATPGPDGAFVEDGAGGVLAVTENLRLATVPGALGSIPVAAVAAAPDGSIWIVDGHGELLHYSGAGQLLRRITPTLPVATVSVDTRTGAVWLVRSSERFTYRLPGEASPLFERLARGDSIFRPVGRAQIPAHGILADLQNAGHLVARNDTIWFAPFIRDEVIALTAQGDTLWRTVRHLPHSTTEPRFETVDGRAVVNYHPVNLGVSLAPNGRLLVLSTPEGMSNSGRLDELDPASGRLLATTALPTAFPSLAADRTGRIYSVDPQTLLVPGGGRRTPLPAIDLPMADGSRLRSADLRDTPTVLNVWASWCGPCRHELPALDTLRRDLAPSGVKVIGMNDDLDSVTARLFLEKVAPEFPTALGLGRLKQQYGYLGLPWTLLVGSDGQVVGRWIGELTEENFKEIRRAVAAELRRATPTEGHLAHH